MDTVENLVELPVEKIMTKNVQTISANESIADVARMMVEDQYTTLPVLDTSGKCIGILSRSDLTETLLREDQELARFLNSANSFSQMLTSYIDTCGEQLVRELMTQDVYTVSAATSVSKACKSMLNHQVHHLPVVDSDEKVIGIVSTLDVMALLAH